MDDMTRRERERLVREGEIVDAAIKVFGQKGFEGASMDEIALAAQFTKRTLYLYFESKEELFFAAAYKSFRKLFDFLEEASQGERSGYEKLVQGSQSYYRFYRDFPETVRLIGEIGQVKKKAGEGSLRLKELMQLDNELFQWVASGIQDGIHDGSIRNSVDALKTTFSVVFLMTGFFNQLSVTGSTFMEHFALDPEEFSSYSMNLLFESIKN